MHFKTFIYSENPEKTISFMQEAFEAFVEKRKATHGINYIYLYQNKKTPVLIRSVKERVPSTLMLKYSSDEEKEYLKAIKAAEDNNFVFRYKDEYYGWDVRQTGFKDDQGISYILELSTK